MKTKPPIKKPKYKVDQVVGDLKIIEILPIRTDLIGRARYYKCLCICGNTVVRPSSYFRASKFLTCGCKGTNRQSDRKNAILKRLYQDMFRSNDRRSEAVAKSNLSYEDFLKIVLNPCFYCGVPYCMERKDMAKGKTTSDTIVQYNGIDRVLNEVGHTIENSVPCCTTCNKAKLTMPKRDFLSWIKRVYEFNFMKNV